MKFKALLVLCALTCACLTVQAASIGNQSEGSSIRGNPILNGGIRGDGKMQSHTESVTVVHSAAAETSHIIKAGPGFFFWWNCYNGNAAIRYFQVFDSATVPANTAVPILSIPMAATSGNAGTYNPAIWCTNGIVVANSTTQATLTIGSADSFFTVGSR